VFVLGVVALTVVWFKRPLWPDTPQRRLDRHLTEARQLLANGNPEEAERLVQEVIPLTEELDDRAGEAKLLLGTAQVQQAEKADQNHAAELWQRARASLEEAERLEVPESDQTALQFRLAKVGFYTGDNLTTVIRRLESTVAQCESPAQGYNLLTQAYLKLPRPNLAKAMEANQKLRAVPDAGEADLAAAKLLGGELLLRQGRTEEARKALEKIGPQAPPALLAKARLLRARSLQQDRKFDEAVGVYQKTLADTRAPIADMGRVYFDLGLCFRNMEKPRDATRSWEKCVEIGSEEEASAARLELAELLQSVPPIEQAVENTSAKMVVLLSKAVAKVASPDQWTNALVDLAQARVIFENAGQSLMRAGGYDLAPALTEAYGKIAQAGRVAVLQGEFAAAGAHAYLQKAKEAIDPPSRQIEEGKARQYFMNAGTAYGRAADQTGVSKEEKARRLWLSASNYLACEEYARAIAKMESLLKLEKDPKRLGEACYRLGEAYRQIGNKASAKTAYLAALPYETRHSFLARFRLAEAAREEGDVDGAEETLKYNLGRIHLLGPDEEAKEKTLFALGGLYYQRRNFRAARPILETALQNYAKNSEATLARYRLADTYRQLAALENQRFLLRENMSKEAREHFQAEHRRWLRRAAEEFTELAKFLESPAGKGHLTPERQTQVPFLAARSWFHVGEWAKGLEIYDKLIRQHAGKPEMLDALGGAIACHAGSRDIDRVRQRLLEMQKVLPDMEDSVRKPWEAWIAQASAQLPKMEPSPATSGSSPVGRP
jgi:tetratricopeptide (TPR) repeat protein